MTDLRDITSERTRRLVAFLFIFSVLMCHGVFGAAHVSEAQAAVASSPSAVMQEIGGSITKGHGAHHEMKPSDGDSDGSAHHLSAEYFAVFFASLLASAMLFVRVELPGTRTSLPHFGVISRRLTGLTRPLTRGPTSSALQVFRL